MELKCNTLIQVGKHGFLLIEPYGIEIGEGLWSSSRRRRLLIEPYGIEIRNSPMVFFRARNLLIEPYGIEITKAIRDRVKVAPF